MLNAADRETDKEIERIRKRLDEMYARAYEEVREKTNAYFKKYHKMDRDKLNDVYLSRLSMKDYYAWREQKLFVGSEWRSIENQLARRLTSTDVAAMAYVNGELPKIYALNYSAVAKDLNGLGMGFRFDMLDENTVRYLATTDKTLLPYKTVNGKKAERWHTQRVNAEVTQGILQGESMQKIAARLRDKVGMTAKGSAMRNAIVAVGAAQNKGRVDMLYEAKKKGVISKKRWSALHDGRTRDAHRELDGVEVALDDNFENAIGSISYPRDPDADPANVYNCRCRLTYHVMGVVNQETGEYTDLSKIQTFYDPNKAKKARTRTPRKPKVTTPATVYNNIISRDISEKKYAKYRSQLSACGNEDVKAVYEAFQDRIGVIDSHARGGKAYESGGKLFWNANSDLKGSELRKPMSVFFHESGHGNDYFLGKLTGARTGMFSTSWQGGRFSQTIRDEVNEWVSRVSTQFGGDVNSAYRAISKELISINRSVGGDYKVHALSDIVGGVTLNKATCGWGHKTSYWYTQDPAVEAFAEMSEAYVTGAESLEVLRKYLPRSVACFDEMMKYARGLI